MEANSHKVLNSRISLTRCYSNSNRRLKNNNLTRIFLCRQFKLMASKDQILDNLQTINSSKPMLNSQDHKVILNSKQTWCSSNKDLKPIQVNSNLKDKTNRICSKNALLINNNINNMPNNRLSTNSSNNNGRCKCSKVLIQIKDSNKDSQVKCMTKILLNSSSRTCRLCTHLMAMF